ncbi:MAG: ABC transporter permease [Bacteroidales bacterium]|nr:ABC transporter permease [Bacteroidales bacterium]
MNFEYFISRRLLSGKEATFSKPIVSIAVGSIALSLIVMFISIAIITGFKKQIREKVIGFGGHIQISNFDLNRSFEANPIDINTTEILSLQQLPNIKSISGFALKAGIIRADQQIEGIILKGVTGNYDWSFFEKNLVAGELPLITESERSKQVMVSDNIAKKLNLKVGSSLKMYFIFNNQQLGRAFNVSGIYKSGLEEFDNMYVIGDIKQIQRLNKWNPEQVSGAEITINEFEKLDLTAEQIYRIIGYDLRSQTIRELHPEIFDWLQLQNMNVFIILAVMTLVAGATMISILLILILERINMIGILKAMGATNKSIIRIFLYHSVYIISKGLIIGNFIALGLSFLQMRFGLLKLDEKSYYISKVPIELNFTSILELNLATIIICILILLIPSLIITRIAPAKAIRFD